MNAPKKVWVDPENRPLEWWGEEYKDGGDVPYIRADLVDELVKALKAYVSDEWNGQEAEIEVQARAALKKMEEE